MAVEPIWSARELQSLGNAVASLEDTLQAWESEHDVKITDLLINVGTMERPTRRLGLVGLRERDDTILQFEALEADLTIS